jgi:hypothetical protein
LPVPGNRAAGKEVVAVSQRDNGQEHRQAARSTAKRVAGKAAGNPNAQAERRKGRPSLAQAGEKLKDTANK